MRKHKEEEQLALVCKLAHLCVIPDSRRYFSVF